MVKSESGGGEERQMVKSESRWGIEGGGEGVEGNR